VQPFAKSILATMIGVVPACVIGQTPPRNQWGYNFPESYDAEIAAPDVHRVRYADDHIMLMEVANPPGYPMQMHGHPYPSVFARSSGRTNIGGGGPGDGYLEPHGGRNGEHWHSAPSPAGTPSLECTAADPQAPHRPVNHGAVPQHFYRIEFKRINDERPAVADLYRRSASRKLYEDDVVRLFDVVILPGRKGRSAHFLPPAVLAFDTDRAFEAVDAVVGSAAGRSAPPTGMSMPRCMTIDAATRISLRNAGTAPLHYYRLEFKRIEGSELKDHWREWYPWMTKMH
jgi:hypothetical protein